MSTDLYYIPGMYLMRYMCYSRHTSCHTPYTPSHHTRDPTVRYTLPCAMHPYPATSHTFRIPSHAIYHHDKVHAKFRNTTIQNNATCSTLTVIPPYAISRCIPISSMRIYIPFHSLCPVMSYTPRCYIFDTDFVDCVCMSARIY